MKFDFSGLAKNKNMIIILVAMIIVCGGSLLGVKSMTSSLQTPSEVSTTIPTQPTVSTTIPQISTTAPATTEPTMVPTTEPTTADSLITTFPMDNTTTVPTTIPTTVPTTADTSLTFPSLQMPTNSGSNGNSSGGSVLGGIADNVKPDGTLFDQGVAGFQFNKTGNYYYTNTDPWQRALGYNEIYDNAAAFTAIYIDTMRCKFRYDNKDWMIQFWKGQYGYLFIGHEIGVYYKGTDRTAEHYDCVSDEDSLYMEMDGLRDGEVLYHRDYAKYWWCTGFVPGKLDKFSDRSELQIDARITMKDKEMLGAFVESLEKNGMIKGEDFKVKGLDVYVIW